MELSVVVNDCLVLEGIVAVAAAAEVAVAVAVVAVAVVEGDSYTHSVVVVHIGEDRHTPEVDSLEGGILVVGTAGRVDWGHNHRAGPVGSREQREPCCPFKGTEQIKTTQKENRCHYTAIFIISRLNFSAESIC